MIRFEILGTVDLKTADGATADAFLKQPKAVALLAFLALARPHGYVRRDVLLGLLWPDSDQSSARGALSSTLYRVRQQLGTEVVESRGSDEVALGQNVWCDASEFRRLLADGDKEAALELYRGPLLPGFFIPSSDTFERWVDEERILLRRSANTAVLEVTEAAREAGDLVRATRWARQALAISPHDEAALRKLLGLYASAGNRAAALNAYESFARQLKREYEIEPDAATQALIRQIARATAAPSEVDSPALAPVAAPRQPAPGDSFAESTPDSRPIANSSDPSAAHPISPHAPLVQRSANKRKWWAAAAAVFVLFGILSFTVLGPAWDRTGENTEVLPRVAVLYIDVDESDAHLRDEADALTESLISRLSGSEHFDVLSSTAVREFRQANAATAIEKALKPTYVVHASMRGENGKVRLTVELIDAATGANRSSEVIERDTASLFELTDELVRETSTMLRIALGKEVQLARWQRTAANAEAARMLHRAELARTSSRRMRELHDRVAERRLLLVSDSLAVKASRLDPDWPEPDALRAKNAEALFANAWPMNQKSLAVNALTQGIEAATTALKKSPGFAPALQQRGTLLMLGWASHSLPGEEQLTALADAERDLVEAVRLDPRRAQTLANLATVRLFQNRIPEARLAAERAYEADAFMDGWRTVLATLFNTSFELGDVDEGGKWCREMELRMDNDWAPAYCRLMLEAYTTARPRSATAAWQLAQQGVSSVEPERRPSIQVMLDPLVAAILARHDMKDSAVHVLEATYKRRALNPESLRLVAATWLAMGEHERADSILTEFSSTQPENSGHIRGSRLFSELRPRHSEESVKLDRSTPR